MYQREVERRQAELKAGENRQKNLLAAAMGGGDHDKDHDYSTADTHDDDVEEHKAEEKKLKKGKLPGTSPTSPKRKTKGRLFRASVLRRASEVPKSSVMVLGSKTETARAQGQSVEAYSSIMKRGGKLRRAIRSVEKLNTKAHDKKAILDRVEKFIPVELRDAKVAIMSFALSKQLKDQAANIFMTNINSADNDKYDNHPNSSMKNMADLMEGDENAEDKDKKGLEKNYSSAKNNHHGFQHYFYVGMGEAGHMGEFSEGQVDMHNKHEFIGESARQSFFDRFQRIAINQYDEGSSPTKVVEKLCEDAYVKRSLQGTVSRTRVFSMGMEGRRFSEEEHLGEEKKGGEGDNQKEEDPLPKLHPMDKYLATCIEENIAPEPLLVKKSYFSGSSFDEWAKETQESKEGGKHAYKEGFFRKLKSDLKFKHSVDNLIFNNFGMGDQKVKALAGALSRMPFVRLVDISYNRLTHNSLPTFLSSVISHETLMNLNLSGNTVDAVVAEAVRDFLTKTVALKVLIMDNCNITDKELAIFSTGFVRSDGKDVVKNLGLSKNKIRSRGGEIFGDLFEQDCSIEMLDLSHNMIHGKGAVAFGNGLAHNTKVKVINLEVNRIGSEGTMAIGKSLNTNTSLSELNLQYNGIGMKGCFVMASVLRKNTTLKKMSMIGNALGEQGGRCLMRAIMEGMVCWLKMTGCTFQNDLSLDYDHSNPEKAYGLDLNGPYGSAILNELANTAVTKELCGFSQVKHFVEMNKQGQYVKGNSIELNFDKNNETITRLIAKIQECVRGLRDAGATKRFELEAELKNTKLKLRAEFSKVHKSLPKEGRLTFYFKCDKRLPGIYDCLTDNAIETWIAIIHNAKTDEDRVNWLKLVMCDYYVTTTQIQYVLDKLDSMQSDHMKLDRRQVLLRTWMKILDSDKKYAFMSKQLEDGEDRNGLAKMLGFTRFRLNFLNPTGHWRLDLADANHQEVWQMLLTLEGKERAVSKSNKGGDTSQKGNHSNFRNEKLNGIPLQERSQDLVQIHKKGELSQGTLEFDFVSTTRPPKGAVPCTDAVFTEWLENMGINDSVQDPPGGVMFQMYLTHAACQHYFTVQQVCKLIVNVAPDKDQSDAAVAMFARTVDLENFDEVLKMREIKVKFKQDIVNRIGWLNVGNPMKPEGLYDIDMMEFDQRAMLKVLMTMGSSETGVHIKDVKGSDLTMQELYGNSSMLGMSLKKHVKLEYVECKGELLPNFNLRKTFVDQFLVGQKPVRDGLWTVARQFTELEKAGKLSSGPIKKQHEIFLREGAKAKKNWNTAKGKVNAMNMFSSGVRQRQKTRHTVRVRSPGGSLRTVDYHLYDEDPTEPFESLEIGPLKDGQRSPTSRRSSNNSPKNSPRRRSPNNSPRSSRHRVALQGGLPQISGSPNTSPYNSPTPLKREVELEDE